MRSSLTQYSQALLVAPTIVKFDKSISGPLLSILVGMSADMIIATMSSLISDEPEIDPSPLSTNL